MNRMFKSLLISFVAFVLFVGSSYAATSVRLQTPPSQTNVEEINLTFVALDTDSSQTVSVDCYKKGPSDASYSVFQTFSLTNGGNTNNCDVHFNQGNGTYSFYVKATGTSTTTSSTVNVDFNNSTPGIPTGYSKEKTDSCTYKISFKTADDSGKTVKVYLYRSETASFDADDSHKVNSINIGSNTESSMTDNINPNCNTNYYYAIRAFDAYGNGSGVVGDSNTTTVNPTITQEQGAIANGTNGNALSSSNGSEAGTKGVLGTESAKTTPTPSEKNVGSNPIGKTVYWIATHKKIDLLVLLVLGAIAYYLYRKYEK